ncbi:MAG: hypothetical protein JST31_03000 [Actinobacteria bacterium]|nr:hypothetical protein [Actinomycetota bacterium]
MPTTRRRHAITETPPVKEALDELRAELGSDKVPMGEIVVLGARDKLRQLRAEREGRLLRRRRLTDRIRAREPLADPLAAAEIRRQGWARPL